MPVGDPTGQGWCVPAYRWAASEGGFQAGGVCAVPTRGSLGEVGCAADQPASRADRAASEAGIDTRRAAVQCASRLVAGSSAFESTIRRARPRAEPVHPGSKAALQFREHLICRPPGISVICERFQPSLDLSDVPLRHRDGLGFGTQTRPYLVHHLQPLGDTELAEFSRCRYGRHAHRHATPRDLPL